MPTDPTRAQVVFVAAAEMTDPAARALFVAEACGGDLLLQSRVEALLRAHDQPDSLLDAPLVAPPDPEHAATRAYAPNPAAELTRTSVDGTDTSDDEPLTFLSPATRPDSVGRLGHYEMLQVLGKGGFGIVFRAFDDMLQRVVAIKVMAPQMAATSPARRRFLREARSSAQVRHENVVQVYEVGEQPLPYLAMEFIPGETLQQKLDRSGPLDVPEVLRIGRQIAEGLAAAHASDLIHRDIKPGNILLEGGSHKVKITDFGLARAADDASISQSGIIAGTPLFMAPEQALGQHIDRRADLFSLGSVLYQMVSGRPPFRAPTALAVLKRVAEESPRPIPEIIPETPEWLCGIIAKLHAKNPDDRYQSAREVADVLADCEAQLKANSKLKDFSRIPAAKPAPRRSRRWKWATAAAALLLLAAGAIAFGTHARRYIGNRGEVELIPEPGWVAMIALRDDNTGTDWVDVKDGPTIKLPPGKYHFNAGFAKYERTVGHWEITTYSLFSSHTVLNFSESPEFEVVRGERYTIRAVMRDRPGIPENGPPPLSPKTDGDWIQLFNGKDLTGWKYHPNLPGAWKVQNGLLMSSGPANYLFSERDDFANFHVRAEVKISPKGNSGLLFRATWNLLDRPDVPRPGGHEAQIFGGNGSLNTGSLLEENDKLSRMAKDFFTPPNEWFVLEVIANGNRITINVNGKTTVDCTEKNQIYTKGHIALQQFTPATVVQFRKIEIKELPPDRVTEQKAPPIAAASPYALAFDGESSYVTIPTLKFNGDHSITMEAWTVLQRLADSPVLEYLIGNPELAGLGIGTGPANQPGPKKWSFDVSLKERVDYVRAWEQRSLPRNQLVHVAGVYVRNNEVRFYVNGQLQSRAPALGVHKPSPLDFCLGANPDAGDKFVWHFLGRMNEVRISNVARYEETFKPASRFEPDANTLALYHFEEGAGNVLKDSSGNGYHGKIVGAKWVKADGSPVGPSPAAPLPPTFKNSIGMEFVIVPKGKSWLGGDKDKLGDQEVEIPADFYLGKYEVTQEEWEKVMGENPSSWSRRGDGKDAVKNVSDADLKRFPVENVSWDQCQVFVEKLNRLEKESGWVYRLPKMAEWEYACRGGPMSGKMDSGYDFYFYKPTNTLLPERANFDRGFNRTVKVGSYEPNRLGLFDMHGNVAEWCDDIRKAEDSTRYLRGGCWGDESRTCRAQHIGTFQASLKGKMLGLRLARVSSGAPAPEAKMPPQDPDRQAAEYILSIGGAVRVNDQQSDLKAIADLPREPFRLTYVNLRENEQVSDADLVLFKDCKNLVVLGLERTKVSDAGLAHFKDCKSVTQLWLNDTKASDEGLAYFKHCKNLTGLGLQFTQVSDAGLADFKDCKMLTQLWLGGTQVSDVGLAHFKDCKNLMSLRLGKTKVTAAGIDELKKALPKCKIEWDGGVIEPK